jgi:hypothetical protein
MTKVYIVGLESEFDSAIVIRGVFSSREAADKYLEWRGGYGWVLEEFALDFPV